MKKIIIALLLLSATYFPAHACDICGCSVSNYNPILFPHLSRRYISLSFIHRAYQTSSEEGLTNKESFNSYLLTGQYSVGKKWQVIALLPYQANTIAGGKERNTYSGIGDIILLGNYKAWDKITKRHRQTILIGGGVKLPTGKNKTGLTENKQIQLGSGSIDYLVNASYRLSLRNWMFGAAGSYKYNTQNRNDLRFGDVLTSGLTVAYRKDWNAVSIAPYMQAIKEVQFDDADQHILQKHSGGNALYTGAGIDITTRKFTVGCNYQWAAVQNLAQGEIVAKPRLTSHISFVF